MPTRARGIGPDATVPRGAAENNLSNPAKLKPAANTVSESAKTEGIASSNEDEIARIAYQLWLSKGCPAGLDQADWFRAEVLVRNGAVASCEDASKLPSTAGRKACIDYEMVTGFEWVGHWEVWESEWAGAHWVSDQGRVPLGALSQRRNSSSSQNRMTRSASAQAAKA